MKIRMNICGRNLIMSAEVANEIMELAFTHGEIFEENWHRGEDGKSPYYTKHVYDINPSEFNFTPELITDGQYEMYKLAGKPKH
jgi:hypothetical protein